ncbi:3-hydroxyacyl-CoA dehydrogenase family protein [Aminipila butyrica]|uniref:L-gulonate 3-dehydrogenase n=1 Tax=Aminipila butyrica TaxID=433296 RepID=A0A858BUX3_9FIRM|nr:3-hydroxyacyl-CoA dehydrogenase family protein [Aminipila butyrica]QIB67866.1 3-hydroxyacyl-CoA dehydrogenase family protein [Aminipila butyrica]
MNRENVKKIGIIGTGMIGTSLAALTAGHGIDTVMLAVNEDLRAASQKQFDSFYADLVAQKLINNAQAANCAKNLSYTLAYNELADCDLIFECVVERLEVKHEVYTQIEATCSKVRAICSVSSAFVVDDLASEMTVYKDRVIVTHPFNPPHLVPYFELAVGSATNPDVLSFAMTVLEDLDRKPVALKKSAPGFIGNRLQFALWREALNIVDSGIADPADVDTCLMYSFCPRYTSIGMFEHFDNGGLDLNYNVCKTIFPTLNNVQEVPESVATRVASGDLGLKTGKGFYDWSQKDISDFHTRVSDPYWRFFNWEVPEEE